MSPFVKAILDIVVKPAVDSEIAQLKANRDTNVASIEATIAPGGSVTNAVTTFLLTKLKSTNPFVNALENVAFPALEASLSGVLGTAAISVPAAYDAGLTFLEKEDAYL